MNKRKSVFLGIAFGTSVRDVLRTDTFRKLRRQKNIDIVVFLQDTSEEIKNEIGASNVFIEKLHDYEPNWWEKLILHFHKTLLREKCRTIDLGNTGADTSAIDKLTPFVKFLRLILSFHAITKIIFWLYSLNKKPTLYAEQFQKYNPDLVVVTRVLNFSRDYPLLRMAANLKVPVISLVSSWDNLTSKGFFPFQLNSLVVWNDVIKNEAIDLFNFPTEKIVVTGIPRYDFFFNLTKFSPKEEFCNKFGLDPNKRIILYGTGSATTGRTPMDATSPEPEINAFIAEKMNEGCFGNDVQLIVRLHPQANPESYKILDGVPNVYVHVPGKIASFQDRLFSASDDQEFAESLNYSDVVINLNSTITIDAAVFNVPIICINYDHRGNRPFRYSVLRMYEFDHYAKLLKTGGFRLANSKEDLLDAINEALMNPSILEEGRKRILEQQCHFTDGKAGERTADHLIEFLSKS